MGSGSFTSLNHDSGYREGRHSAGGARDTGGGGGGRNGRAAANAAKGGGGGGGGGSAQVGLGSRGRALRAPCALLRSWLWSCVVRSDATVISELRRLNAAAGVGAARALHSCREAGSQPTAQGGGGRRGGRGREAAYEEDEWG